MDAKARSVRNDGLIADAREAFHEDGFTCVHHAKDRAQVGAVAFHRLLICGV